MKIQSITLELDAKPAVLKSIVKALADETEFTTTCKGKELTFTLGELEELSDAMGIFEQIFEELDELESIADASDD